ncbi:hypothetical protein PYW07_007686 [Mythimna separata]|uniref:Uncharacterized protein n=1 Tax=Mythimna separata TaxID=271217 RepID=A0AAD8DTZ3_MYTSE|nr:hypothetical protein PYW07_007686 [Mythimna separata]
MKNVLLILFSCVVITLGQLQWAQRARVRQHTEFFSEVIQETIYRLEKRGFSSLTVTNVTQTVNEQMYKFVVNGTAVYTNGFLISMQKIDVTTMSQSVNMPTIDGVQTPRATVSGTLNFRTPKLGFDVIFYAVSGEVLKFTGDFTYNLISFPISIQQNLTTKDVTVTVMLNALTAGGTTRMVYRPANGTTEVISRGFSSHQNFAGVRTWENIIQPIIVDIVKNKIPFPAICYNHC